jgi:hypothetical protein
MSDVTSAEIDTNPEWLDPEEFPFTEAEVLEAAILWRNYGEARHFMREIANLERSTVLWRRKNQAEMTALPADPNRIIFEVKRAEDPSSKWLWPALSVLSESCAERVRDRMSRHWERREQGLVMEAQMNELKRNETVAEIIRLSRDGGDREAIRALVEQTRREGVGLKEATEEMRRTASETVERERAAWLALAAESKRRFEASHPTTGSPPATPPRP